MVKFLDSFRIIAVCIVIYWSYNIGFANDVYNPVAQLHIMIPLIIILIAGVSGAESLLMGDESAKEKGFEVGSNYQKQSALAMLSYSFGAILIYILDWGIKAELSLLFTFLFFFLLSAINHAYVAIKKKNYKWQNINRPFITAVLIGSFLYPVIKALNALRF